MALAAAARRSLASRLSSRFHPSLPHLLTPHCSVDAATPSPHLHLPPPQFPHFPFPRSSGTAAQTLTLFPLGIHLAGAGLSCRGFSSLPPYRVADAGAVLTDAADAGAAPAAAGSFPSEVAWIAEDSSVSVAAVQHLIDAVHSFTGLNWWLSIAVSTVLLRCVWLTLYISARKLIPVTVMRQELSAAKKLMESANDEKSQIKAFERSLSLLKSWSPLMFVAILKPYTFMALYFAISNMVENLPSLKEGGAFWFTDLTTPDALYIFPAVASLSLILRYEFFVHYSRKARSRKMDVFKALCVLLTFPLAATLPQAICCYYVTWSFAALTQNIVLHQPVVKKLLFSLPNKPTCPSSDGPKGPTAEDSARPIEEHEQPLRPERRKASDSSIDQVRDKSDEKPEKGN